ncbi:NAD(P)-binding domain-containing protein [Streptomyces sp. MJP52]|uniref:NAD(P)-dependent oxidoreductase n=1 Tax=Streptomyces sp. MJP52 TaxID=2940555 RepID=UPI002475FB13|nr:NAD(P)-binding domain-containing protein [Streptomyces sp. MJP52]MDH6223547.1 3-hydroxyisobutyrate dehydrogenase-like beta-hydroxyacid dehydrogenase [Streptomyces sp. MJP52]
MSATPVTLVGLGPMGRAMVRALLAAGHPVTVWNRTADRAAGAVADGATLAASPADALAASELVILSLTDYRAMYDVLGGATTALTGRTIVNLSSDTPDRAREAAAWAAGHGAHFVVGGVMVPPPMVGTEAAYVYYSGPSEVFEAHRPALTRIGAPRHLGEDPGLAQLMYLAHLDVFLTSLSALMHATALLGAAGISATRAVPELMPTVAGIPAMLRAGGDDPGARIDAGEHPGDMNTVTMMGATAEHVLDTSDALGIDLALPRAVRAHYLRAIADGHGKDGWTRIVDGIRTPRTPA